MFKKTYVVPWFVSINTFDLHCRKTFQLEIAFTVPLQSHLDIPVTHFTTSVSTSPPYLHPPPSPHRKPHIYLPPVVIYRHFCRCNSFFSLFRKRFARQFFLFFLSLTACTCFVDQWATYW